MVNHFLLCFHDTQGQNKVRMPFFPTDGIVVRVVISRDFWTLFYVVKMLVSNWQQPCSITQSAHNSKPEIFSVKLNYLISYSFHWLEWKNTSIQKCWIFSTFSSIIVHLFAPWFHFYSPLGIIIVIIIRLERLEPILCFLVLEIRSDQRSDNNYMGTKMSQSLKRCH